MKDTNPKKPKNGKLQYILTMIAAVLAVVLMVGYTVISFYLRARTESVTLSEKTFVIVAVLMLGIMAYFSYQSYRDRARAIEYAEKLRQYQSNLEERVHKQTKELRHQSDKLMCMQENVTEGMANLIERRDGSTGEHVHNTKMYVSMILKYMTAHNVHSDVVTDDYAKNVTNATVLHDVGKIQISDVILNKPGRFTPEEYEVMKTHAEIGGRLIKEILGDVADDELVHTAEDIARYHHEKWDGSGYPTGISGTDIPLSARIMAVADVFDALVSERVYKERMSLDEAFEILKADAGKHFDPQVVDIFCSIRPEVERYLNDKDSKQ